MLVEVVPVRYARTTISTGTSLHSRARSTFGSGTREHVVVRDVAGLLEPPGGGEVQDLPFERQRAEHAIEGADAVRGDDHAPPVGERVVVADLALVFRPELREVGRVERFLEGVSEGRFGDGGHGAEAIPLRRGGAPIPAA